jgi:ABC-type cobalamin/Fe3+-siderophores transport system ATPase subunit
MASEEKMVIGVIQVPTLGGNVVINVSNSRPVFILGRNGTGKSALVNHLHLNLGDNVVYMPGSRSSFFEYESLSLNPATRRQLSQNMRAWDRNHDARWRVINPSSRNEKAVHDLQAAETQYKIDAANQIKAEGTQSAAISRLQTNSSPLDRVNALLLQANLPVRLLIDSGELRATQSGAIYSFARMSDGERSSLVFAAEVVAAPTGTVFVIDEPELHLHPSIVVPLLEALINERPDCAFVICTHELELPSTASSAMIVLVRAAVWRGETISTWEIDVLDDSSQIPESLRVDLLGSRQKILFIEGTSTSLDQPLYALLFPLVSVRSRTSCRDVMRAVEGLRTVKELHRAQAYGLVDHDGMSADQAAQLEESGVYPLPVFAVESLYYSADVLVALAARQAQTLGIDPAQIMAEATEAALHTLKSGDTVQHLASRLAERHMRDQLLLAMPTRDALIGGQQNISISVESPYAAELDRINRFIEFKDVDAIISRYPVRESGVLTALAKALRFNGRADYERAALTLVGLDQQLRERLIARLGNLAAQLA